MHQNTPDDTPPEEGKKPLPADSMEGRCPACKQALDDHTGWNVWGGHERAPKLRCRRPPPGPNFFAGAS